MKKIVYIVVGVIAGLAVLSMVVTATIWPVITEVETGITPQYPEIQPHYYSTGPERIYQEALSVVDDLERWELVQSDGSTFQIEAERSSRLFGFVDDVSIRVEPVTEFVSQIHLRSASRRGAADFGQNARNIELFLQELDERLGAVKFEPGGEDEDDEDSDEEHGDNELEVAED